MSDRRRVAWRRVVVALAVALGFVPTLVGTLESAGPTGALTPAEREAMRWVRDNTTTSTATVSLATDRWGSDDVSEWFPALSERSSATTTQGLEWSGEVRDEVRAAEAELRDCQDRPADRAACIDEWVTRHVRPGPVVIYVARSSDTPTAVDALIADLTAGYGYVERWTSDGGVLLGAAER